MEGSSASDKLKNSGGAKHIVLAKFKPEVSQQEIDQLIKDFANLEDIIPSVKTFNYGMNVSTENLDQGFRCVFVLGFDDVAGIQQYLADPAHIQFANRFLKKLSQVLVVDYQSTPVPH